MSTLKWIDNNLERLLAAALLAGIVILISVNVLMRYVFNSSLSWGEELTLWIFVWFVWISISYTFQQGQHIRITVFADRFRGKARKVLETIVSVLILTFLAVLTIECIKLMSQPFVASQKSVVLGLPIPILYASAPVGAVLSGYRVTQHLVRTFRSSGDAELGDI